MSKLFLIVSTNTHGVPDRVMVEAKGPSDALEQYAAKLVIVEQLNGVDAAKEARAGTKYLAEVDFEIHGDAPPLLKAAS